MPKGDIQNQCAESKGATPYRPSNSTEGGWFEAKFCGKCDAEEAWRKQEKDPCPILGNALAFDIGDEHFPPEWVSDENGPRCTAFRPIGTPSQERIAKDRARYEAALAEMRRAGQ